MIGGEKDIAGGQTAPGDMQQGANDAPSKIRSIAAALQGD